MNTFLEALRSTRQLVNHSKSSPEEVMQGGVQILIQELKNKGLSLSQIQEILKRYGLDVSLDNLQRARLTEQPAVATTRRKAENSRRRVPSKKEVRPRE